MSSFESYAAAGVEVFEILDVAGDADPAEDGFPDWPEGAHDRYRSIYPKVYGAEDSWHFLCRGWLLRDGGRQILFDTGIGVGSAPGPAWFGSDGQLQRRLTEVGSSASEIDTVVLSHVHDDHIGGTVDSDGAPAFANARYVLQRADLEWQRASADENDGDREIWEKLLEPLEAAGMIDPIDGHHQLTDTIALEHAPGHTPGHQIMWVGSGDDRLLLAGDSFNHPAQLDHPDWPSGPDNDREMAAGTRRKLLAELAATPGMVFAPTHFGEAFGRMAVGADHAVLWEPLHP